MAELRDETLWEGDKLRHPHAQSDKGDRVRRMFDAIAPTYERINTLFSAGRDRAWRAKAVALAAPSAGDALLDIACGTGDFAGAFHDHLTPPGLIVGCDFARNMLVRAACRRAGVGRWVQADALALPFADGSFTLASCAFGVRNFQDLDAGLCEMHRVLTPAGRVVILEFTRPPNRLWRRAYEFYASRIMPAGATLVSRDRTGAYRYLPHSVVSFADARTMCERLRHAGFAAVTATPMTLGIVTLYRAVKGG